MGCVIALLSVGCASTPKHLRWYEGPALGTNNVGILKIHQDPVHYVAFIQAIDGASINEGKGQVFNNTEDVELLPGKHEVAVSFMDTNGGRSLSNAILSFKSEASHVYELYVAPIKRGLGEVLGTMVVGGKYNWTAWIVDCGSDKVVAGQKRDEPLHWYE